MSCYKKTHVRFFTLLAAALFIALIAACQSGGNQNAVNDAQPETKAPAEEQPQEVELNVFSTSNWSQEQFDERFGNALGVKFPHFKLNYITGMTYEELLTSGEQVDIVWESLAAYASAREFKIQHDMSDLIKQLQVDLSRINPAYISSMETLGDGKMIGLPVLSNGLGLYYNKSIFDRFGVPYPTDQMTFDEVLELSRQLTRQDDGDTYIGLSLGWPNHYFRLNSFSAPYVDMSSETTAIRSDTNWSVILNLFNEVASIPLYKEFVTNEQRFIENASFFKDRNVAMVATLVNTHMKEDTTDLDWDMVTFPTFREAPGVGPQPSPTIFGIASTSNHKREVMEVIQFLISDEFQLGVSRSGTVPVVQTSEIVNAFGQDTIYKDKNLKAVFHDEIATISNKSKYDSAVEKIVIEQLVPLATGEIDLNTAIRTIEEQGNAAIESMK